MNGLVDSPYAALSLIAAPAILTNASSVLALGTSNRFARAVDRQRQLSALIDSLRGADAEQGAFRVVQLRRAERRAELLIRALTSFYVSLGSFAAAALVSLLGAAVLPAGGTTLSLAVRLLGLTIGLAGVGGLVFGCTLLVRETRVTLASLRDEAAFSRRRFQAQHPHLREAPPGAGPDEGSDDALQ